MTIGVRGGVILESVQVGGARYTLAEALRIFVERCDKPEAPATVRSAAQAAADQLAAEEFLRARGLVVGPE